MSPKVLLGGTFDPVHRGHILAAHQLADRFGFASVGLLPCYQPVHGKEKHVSVSQRVDMLELAVANEPKLSVDTSEIIRKEPSYSVDTLRALRQKESPKTPIYFALGTDAFNHITTWKDWESILTLCNLIVMTRPGSALVWPDSLKKFHEEFNGSYRALGKIYEFTFDALSISSTQIRMQLKLKRPIDQLVPEPVADYICRNRLYVNTL
ncbi:MAG: nicotinate-nucleotide adenylyltransferase [Cellvibrionales bacterium]|nr:nicotinate-nucleotide adenylyltransferase [Cellvibrionales bacterium]